MFEINIDYQKRKFLFSLFFTDDINNDDLLDYACIYLIWVNFLLLNNHDYAYGYTFLY